MKIKVHTLKDGETSFLFKSGKDGWLKTVVDRVEKQGFPVKSELDFRLRVTKLDPDYYVQGLIGCDVELTCARCAERYVQSTQHPFELAFARLSKTNLQKAEAADDSDEVDVTFFEGEEINVSPVVEEQFHLSLPYKALCRKDCKGICQVCGKNLNLTDCACKKSAKPSPFSALEELKVNPS